MDWIVKKVGNVDAERQHLNKILAEIRAAIDSIPTTSSTTTHVINNSVFPEFTLSLSGDASGSVDIDGEDATLPISITFDGVEEAPIDSRYYWRRNADWQPVHESVTNLSEITGSGFTVSYQADEDSVREWVTREITGTTDRIVVTNGTGISANPVINIAATYVGQTSITTLGTISTGVWQGSVVQPAYGGTGIASYAVGDIIYASGTTTLSKLAATTSGFVLTANGTGVAPSWQAVDIAAKIHAATGKTTPVDADEIGIADSAASFVLKKVTFANLSTWIGTKLGPLIVAATGKTTPVDADSLVISDSAASDATKKVSLTNFKAFLKTYFDTLYAAIGPTGALVDTTSASTSYTLASGDNGKHIRFSAATTVTVTIDSGLPANFYCVVRQDGAGQVQVIQGTVTTFRTAGTAKSRVLYSPMNVYAATTSIVYVDGDMAAS